MDSRDPTRPPVDLRAALPEVSPQELTTVAELEAVVASSSLVSRLISVDVAPTVRGPEVYVAVEVAGELSPGEISTFRQELAAVLARGLPAGVQVRLFVRPVGRIGDAQESAWRLGDSELVEGEPVEGRARRG